MLRGENTQKVYRLGDKVKVQVDPRQHGGAADRSRPGRDSRARPRRRARAAAQQGRAEAPSSRTRKRSARARRARAPQTARLKADRAMLIDEVGRRRHRGAHRSRQERARPGADRHRSRSAEGREGARHHDRSRLRAPDDRRHQLRLRRRARPRAVRQEHARRRRRHRPRRAGRRGRRIGHAADARALRHLPAAARPGRPHRAHKSDLADADTLRAGAIEVRELVAGSFLDGAPIVPVSARTGEGLDELRAALVERQPARARPRGDGGRPGCRSIACSR